MERRPRKTAVLLAYAALCLPLPRQAPPDLLTPKLAVTSGAWEKHVTPKDAVATLKFVSEAPFGMVLEAGNWLSGTDRAAWRASKKFPATTGTVTGSYRTEGLSDYGAVVTVSFFKQDKLLAERRFHLKPALPWTAFELPVRSVPGGADALALEVGIEHKGASRALFARLAYAATERRPLVACPGLGAFTRAPAPAGLPKGPAIRVRTTPAGAWLVDPDGHGFFSTGVAGTYVSGAKAVPTLKTQLTLLGFNSLGDSSFYPDWYKLNAENPKAATRALHVFEPPATGEASDPFSAGFVARLRAKVRQVAPLTASSPWLLGYVADGKPGFGDLERRFWEPASAAAFIARLRAHYLDVRALNAEWGTSVSSFEELAGLKPAPKPERAGMVRDFASFKRVWLDRYLTALSSVIRELDPNHLVYSPRLKLGPELGELLPYMDLFGARFDALAVDLVPASVDPGLSFNERALLDAVARASGRPLLITGFTVEPILGSESARAHQAAQALTELYNLPYVLGVHWSSASELMASTELREMASAFNGHAWPESLRPVKAPAPPSVSAVKKPANDPEIWVR